MSQSLRCSVRSGRDVTTVHPRGRLDRGTTAELRAVLNKAIAESPTAIVVDLSDLVVYDDLCLILFPTIAEQAAAGAGTCLVLCGANAAVARSLSDLGPDRTVQHYPTRSEAYHWAHNLPYAPRLRLPLAPDLDAPRRARELVAAACAEWMVPDRVTEHLLLITTELVGNAVLHARTMMEVVLRRSQTHLHIAVLDGDERLVTLRGPVTPYAVGGRGLMLVDAFASAWGCAPTASGKRTWATVRHVPDALVHDGSPPDASS
jgi:anti-anti-sigma factor